MVKSFCGNAGRPHPARRRSDMAGSHRRALPQVIRSHMKVLHRHASHYFRGHASTCRSPGGPVAGFLNRARSTRGSTRAEYREGTDKRKTAEPSHLEFRGKLVARGGFEPPTFGL